MKKIIALVISIVLLVCMCGCGHTTKEAEDNGRFSAELQLIKYGSALYIVTDGQTGQQYLYVANGYISPIEQ